MRAVSSPTRIARWRRYERSGTIAAAGRKLARNSPTLWSCWSITATARKLALLVYRALSGKLAYHDPGTAAYLKLNRVRELKSLRKRAKLLGFELVDRSSGEVLLNPVS